jgi:hypothetical protein
MQSLMLCALPDLLKLLANEVDHQFDNLNNAYVLSLCLVLSLSSCSALASPTTISLLTALLRQCSYNNKDRPAAENALRNIEDGINQVGQVGNQLAEQMADPNQKRGLLKALNNLEKVGVVFVGRWFP